MLGNEGFEGEAKFGDFSAVTGGRSAEDLVAEEEVALLFYRQGSIVVPGEDNNLCLLGELLLGDLEGVAFDYPDAWKTRGELFRSTFPPVVHWNGDSRFDLFGDFSCLVGWYGVHPACDWDEQDINLSQHLQLGRGQLVPQVTQVGYADVIHAEDEDGILSSLESLAFVMVGRDRVDGDVPDVSMDNVPVIIQLG